jgi:hypothetical protein
MQHPGTHISLLLRKGCIAMSMVLMAQIAAAQTDTASFPIDTSSYNVVHDTSWVDTAGSTTTIETVATDEEKADPGKYFVSRNSGDYATDTVYDRRYSDSVARKLKKDDAFWYADIDFRKKPEVKKKEEDTNDYEPLLQRKWFRNLMWAIVLIGFIGFLIWYLRENEFSFFRRQPRDLAPGELADEEMPENIFDINYPKEIDKAVAKGDLRLAVRLHYLQLLKRMSEKNIISYKQDKTNSDYLFSLMSTKLYDGFFRLTRHYEYTWYGHFEVTEEGYTFIKNDFDRYTNSTL